MQAVPGGSPFNVAVGLARLGCAVALATDLARDGLGDRLAGLVAREGIADSFLRRSAGTTALAFVTLDAEGVPGYEFRGLREATFTPSDEGLASELVAVSNLHLGSIALVLPASSEGLVSLARSCSARMLVSLDPNVRLSIEPDRGRWRGVIERVRPFAHVVKVSVDDVALAYGEAVEPETMCAEWLADVTELVVLTCGAAGAKLFTRHRAAVAVPAVRGPVIDTVGAGDSFMAALLARLAQVGRLSGVGVAGLTLPELEDLGHYAAAAAALTCSRRGPSLPRRAEIDRLTAIGPVTA